VRGEGKSERKRGEGKSERKDYKEKERKRGEEKSLVSSSMFSNSSLDIVSFIGLFCKETHNV